MATHNGGAGRDVNLHEILPVIPREIGGEEALVVLNPAEAAELRRVGVEDDAVSARLLDADAVVGEAAAGVEVEDPEQARALEGDDLVAVVLERDVRLRAVQPAVLLLRPLHLAVELVQELVPQQVVVGEVELASRVVEGVVVAGAWEVEPFRVSELVAEEVEVAFAAEAVGDQTDHLVQGHTALDDGGECAEGGHVGVHFGIAQPEEKGLVTDERLVVRLGVCDGLLAVAPVGQSEHEVAHVPVNILLFLQPLDVQVRNCHC